MDFGSVLHAAQKNKAVTKEPVRCYSTKFEPPKKEQRSSKTLSANIQKFLARKDAEEKKKLDESKKRREELLALRAQDKKATRRVNVMLKRTKSANQSVIEDAVDEDNTAVTLVGPSQPDEDDYGYVSQEASAFYNKMMEKYNKMPDEPKFDFTKKKVSMNLASTKDRVKAALEKEKEEAMMPHRRKRKHKEESSEEATKEGANNDDNQIEQEEEEDMKESKPKPRPKIAAPPPMNFAELLKMAEKKQFEPIKMEPKPKDEERPLTKKQKKEMEREREWRDRKEGKVPATVSQPFKIPKAGRSSKPETVTTNSTSKESKDSPINKTITTSKQMSNVGATKPVYRNGDSINRDGNRNGDSSNTQSVKSSNRGPTSQDLNKYRTSEASDRDKIKKNPSGSYSDRHNGGKAQESLARSSMLEKALIKGRETSQKEPRRNELPNNASSSKEKHISNVSMSQNINKGKPTQPGNSKPKQSSMDSRPKQPPQNISRKEYHSVSGEVKSRQLPSSGVKPKQFPPNDIKSKQVPRNDIQSKRFPPSNVHPKQFPPNDLRPKQFPPRDNKKLKVTMGSKRRILDDDDEECDSEMDDFIDDGPEEGEDYSKYISEIFGYDKSRYKHLDDDVDNMESSFAQQMREEVISTKIGIMEDLEDMRQEEEEKRKKALMKKKKLK